MSKIFIAIVTGLMLAGGLFAPLSVCAQTQWPGEALLWRGDAPITQTVQYRGLSVIGADYAYLFYDTGLASAMGTAAITVTRQWRGVTFQTITTTATVSTTQRATGAITIASASPYYPDVLVWINITAGTITPTIAVVGQ